MYYMGEYNHSVDAKGRVSVPAKFREGLGQIFVVTKSLDNCLYAYDMDQWNVFAEKLAKLSTIDRESRMFVRFFTSGAAEVEVDKQGRILLPGNLREFAGIGKDAVVAGAGSKVEIWSKENWDASATFDNMDEVAAHMSKLGIDI